MVKPPPCFCLSTVLLLIVSPAFGSQRFGFGAIKKVVVLERRLVPEIRLGPESFAVAFPRGNGGIDANLFSSDLETFIARGNPGVRFSNNAPEFQIQCFPKAVQPVHIATRTDAPSKMFGMTSPGAIHRDAQGNVALDIRIVRSVDDRVLHSFQEAAVLNASNSGGSGNVTFRVPGFGSQPIPATERLSDSDTDASLNARLLGSLAARVASHMVPMNERISVLLAQGGELDQCSRLALNGRWTDYLEKLSTIQPPSDPTDNAYLNYNLGVANEALGYAASDYHAAVKYLEESSTKYSLAVEYRPAEKYFLEPQKRIETALTRYDYLAKSESSQTAGASQESRAATVAGSTKSANSETLTNDGVIRMVRAQIDKQLIMTKIATAPSVKFDVSVNGILSLKENGVPPDIMNLMYNRSQRQSAMSPQ